MATETLVRGTGNGGRNGCPIYLNIVKSRSRDGLRIESFPQSIRIPAGIGIIYRTICFMRISGGTVVHFIRNQKLHPFNNIGRPSLVFNPVNPLGAHIGSPIGDGGEITLYVICDQIGVCPADGIRR